MGWGVGECGERRVLDVLLTQQGHTAKQAIPATVLRYISHHHRRLTTCNAPPPFTHLLAPVPPMAIPPSPPAHLNIA